MGILSKTADEIIKKQIRDLLGDYIMGNIFKKITRKNDQEEELININQ